MLKLRGVSKFYGRRPVFKNIGLELAESSITVLSGPNGAGKSTLLRLIAGLGRPTSGKMEIREGARTAYLGHATFMYPGLSALENLEFWAKLNRLAKAREASLEMLARMGLAAHAGQKVSSFSRGMAQRLNFGRALMLEPDLLLLDEPFTGMDQDSRKMARAEILKRKERGAAVIMVSHDLAEDGPISDRILNLAGGRLGEAGVPS